MSSIECGRGLVEHCSNRFKLYKLISRFAELEGGTIVVINKASVKFFDLVVITPKGDFVAWISDFLYGGKRDGGGDACGIGEGILGARSDNLEPIVEVIHRADGVLFFQEIVSVSGGSEVERPLLYFAGVIGGSVVVVVHLIIVAILHESV